MEDDHRVFRSVDCELHPGLLVRTVCYGYYGILEEKNKNDQWLVFLSNGLHTLLFQQEFRVLPLSCFSDSPASFREILRVGSHLVGDPYDASTEKASRSQAEAPG